MSYKLTTGKTAIIKGKELNGELRAWVKTVIVDREIKNANIIFKIYFGNKDFELENYNQNVNQKEEIDEYTQYFDSPMTEEEKAMDLTVTEFLKKRAYDYINDNELNIGSFIWADWIQD